MKLAKLLSKLLSSIGLFLGCIICSQCNPKADEKNTRDLVVSVIESDSQSEMPTVSTLELSIATPRGYKRVTAAPNSFGEYLRTIKLKPTNSVVHYFDGSVKASNGVYVAVVDLDIGKKDLHQCADAIMRLRGEYLWATKQYDRLHFNFTNGFRVDFTEWMKGRRIEVNGNTTVWRNRNEPSNTYGDFWDYMEQIFMFAGTASLEKELTKVNIEEMQIGDIFIKGGYPGHAVIVMDMAEDTVVGNKLFLLGQSYMPAQETQILVNPADHELSPWYRIDDATTIRTPEWNFTNDQLRRFPEG
jgi:hypothetical protein